MYILAYESMCANALVHLTIHKSNLWTKYNGLQWIVSGASWLDFRIHSLTELPPHTHTHTHTHTSGTTLHIHLKPSTTVYFTQSLLFFRFRTPLCGFGWATVSLRCIHANYISSNLVCYRLARGHGFWTLRRTNYMRCLCTMKTTTTSLVVYFLFAMSWQAPARLTARSLDNTSWAARPPKPRPAKKVKLIATDTKVDNEEAPAAKRRKLNHPPSACQTPEFLEAHTIAKPIIESALDLLRQQKDSCPSTPLLESADPPPPPGLNLLDKQQVLNIDGESVQFYDRLVENDSDRASVINLGTNQFVLPPRSAFCMVRAIPLQLFPALTPNNFHYLFQSDLSGIQALTQGMPSFPL